MTRKKTQSPTKARAKRQARKAVTSAQDAGSALRDTWGAALAALTSAEAEVQRQLGQLMKRNKLTPRDASAALQDLQGRFERERKKAVKQLEASLQEIQGRVKKERQNLGSVVDDAVHGALVAFNIPSRQEVAELTRKVDELSRKIDGLRKAPRASAGVRTRSTARV
jgi:polyhydroxyalkanoate synthesis regulator phasin